MLVISKMFEQKCYRLSFRSCTVGNLCVQFDTEAVCFTFMLHGFCICQVANSRLQKRLESEMKAHEEEREILRTKNQEVQRELEMLKVSVA